MSARTPERQDTLTAVAPAIAVALVAVAVMPPGFNVFGPVKLLVTLAAAATACVAVARRGEARTRLVTACRSPVALAGMALLAAGILSLVTTADARLALTGSYPGYTGLIAALAWAVIGGASASAAPDALRVRLGRAVVVATVVVGVIALLQRLGVDLLASSGTVRVASTLGNASNLGVWLALAAPLVLDRTNAEHGTWNALSGGALFFTGASAALTGSRGGWLALAVALGVWFALAPRDGRPLMKRLAPVLAVLAAFTLAVSLTPGASERATGGGTAADTARGRIAIWSSTIPMIAERPVLGWGVAAYGRAHAVYATPAEIDPTGRTEALEDPHNVMLSVAASTGAVGVLALLSLLTAAGMAVWRGRRGEFAPWTAAVGAALAGGFVALQFHFVTLDTGIAIAVLLGALVGTTATARPSAGARGARRFAPIVLGTAVVLGALAVAAGALVIADVRVREGFAAAEGGDWRSAAESFDSARTLAPWEPAVPWAKGRAAVGSITRGPSIYADGEEALRLAAVRMPGDARPRRDLGDLHVAAALADLRDERWTAALVAYDAALALSPLDPRALLGRGVAAAQLGRDADAERDMLRAVELAPEFADAWWNLGSLYESLGRAGEAASASKRAESLSE